MIVPLLLSANFTAMAPNIRQGPSKLVRMTVEAR